MTNTKQKSCIKQDQDQDQVNLDDLMLIDDFFIDLDDDLHLPDLILIEEID